VKLCHGTISIMYGKNLVSWRVSTRIMYGEDGNLNFCQYLWKRECFGLIKITNKLLFVIGV